MASRWVFIQASAVYLQVTSSLLSLHRVLHEALPCLKSHASARGSFSCWLALSMLGKAASVLPTAHDQAAFHALQQRSSGAVAPASRTCRDAIFTCRSYSRSISPRSRSRSRNRSVSKARSPAK